MGANIAASRLRKELSRMQKEPVPGIIAEPKSDANILTWFYAIRGPTQSPYEGGTYVGKLVFPKEYPMKPPSVLMLTPSGRFQVNTRLCLSMSDFHPESWNPLWSVSSIIQGVQSFMTSEELTTGGLRATAAERKRLAQGSKAYNDKNFANLFHGDMDAAFAQVKAKVATLPRPSASTATSARKPKTSSSAAKKNTQVCSSDSRPDSDQKVLSLEEQERRRKRNAKKRAKQKARKAQAEGGEQHVTGVDD